MPKDASKQPKPKDARKGVSGSGGKTRGDGFSRGEVTSLLESIQKELPRCQEDWERISTVHRSKWPVQMRKTSSIKRKFHNLFKSNKMSSTDPNCPVRMAMRINMSIYESEGVASVVVEKTTAPDASANGQMERSTAAVASAGKRRSDSSSAELDHNFSRKITKMSSSRRGGKGMRQNNNVDDDGSEKDEMSFMQMMQLQMIQQQRDREEDNRHRRESMQMMQNMMMMVVAQSNPAMATQMAGTFGVAPSTPMAAGVTPAATSPFATVPQPATAMPQTIVENTQASRADEKSGED